jgi:hypothetical protein
MEGEGDTAMRRVPLCIHQLRAGIRTARAPSCFISILERTDATDGRISALPIMNFVSITLLVLSFFSNAAVSLEGFGSAPATMRSSGALVPDSYVVTFKDVVSSSAVDAHYQWLEGQFASSDVVVGGKKPGVAHKYHIGDFQAYSGVFSEGMAEMLRKRGEVRAYNSSLAKDCLLIGSLSNRLHRSCKISTYRQQPPPP